MAKRKVTIPTPMSFATGVGLNQFQGYSRISFFGNNPSIDTGTVPEDIWTAGGLIPRPTTASVLEVLSSAAADASAGTGARTMLLVGLDINYNVIQEVITLNGGTPVSTVNSYLRINNAVVLTSGTSNVNVGIITIRNAGAGITRAQIPIGYGNLRQAFFTVPAGHTLTLQTFILSINRPTSTRDCALSTFAGSPDGTYRLPFELAVDGQPISISAENLGILPEKTDVGIRCTYVSANATEISAGAIGVLVNNSYL